MSSKFSQMRPLVIIWQQIGLQWEIRCYHIFSKVFDLIHFILSGNDDIHKSLNEFEIWRDPIMDCGVGCP